PIGGTLDATAPTGAVSSPAPGATGSGTVNVTASASHDVAVGGVQFLLDGQPLGAGDRVAPYSASWDSLKVVNGSHTLSARIRDLAGNTTTTSGTTVTVNNAADTVAPTIRLSVLNGGRPVAGGVVVQADADDNIGVVGVPFKVKRNPNRGGEPPAPNPGPWDTTGLADRAHPITPGPPAAAATTVT